MQFYDITDIAGFAFASVIVVVWLVYEITQWRRDKRWPKSQHRSYFSDCRRVPEE